MNARLSIVLSLLGCTAFAAAQEIAAPDPTAAWPSEALRAFAAAPIQDGGRIKPLETYAGVQLLKFNGMRRCKTPDGQTISVMPWLLDTLFRPELARQYKSFLVESGEVMAMLALTAKKERDRYSYEELLPSRQTLFQLAGQFSAIPDKGRSPAQRQIINLAHNVHEFEQLIHYFDFARQSFDTSADESLTKLVGGQSAVPFSDVLRSAPALAAEIQRLSASGGPAAASPELGAMVDLLRKADNASSRAQGLAVFPPPSSTEKEWLPLGRLLERAFQSADLQPAHLEAVAAIERAAADLSNRSEVAAAAEDFRKAVVSLAETRGEYARVPLELSLLRLNPFYYSLLLYLLSFLFVAMTWMRPKDRWIGRASVVAVSLPTALLAIGIVMRCIIRSRPPVTTLYETILFITAVAVLTALFIEMVNRQRIALSLASALGVIGVFLANKYELVERGDTMPSMVAVLDTNFWLSTHVTTITMGYAAGLLASAIGHVYIVLWALGIKKDDARFYRMLARMAYGVLCFGLLFATSGTVLGGIWANNSWGRFWGWDPKENGALMIVLWQLIILHARIGGYIRDFGIVMGAVFGGIIVAFSWFGVNLLGVGLHSYGFTSGIAQALTIFYAAECCVLFLGALAWVWRPQPVPLEKNDALPYDPARPQKAQA